MAKRERNGGDTAGNAMASALAVQREMLRVAEMLYRSEHILDVSFEHEIVVTAFRVTTPANGRDGYMGVVSALVDGAPCVAFHGAESLHEAFIGCLQRLENRSLKWKEDQWKR